MTNFNILGNIFPKSQFVYNEANVQFLMVVYVYLHKIYCLLMYPLGCVDGTKQT